MRNRIVVVLLTLVAVSTAGTRSALAGASEHDAWCSSVYKLYGSPPFTKKERRLIARAAVRLRKVDASGATRVAVRLSNANTDKQRDAALSTAHDWCYPSPRRPSAPTTTTLPPTQPQVVSGTGDSVVDVTFPQTEPALVHLVHDGSANFIVNSFGSANQDIDLLVNTIGAYDGVRPINVVTGSAVARLQIQADGNWTVEIKPVTTATPVAVPGHHDGAGDQVLFLIGKPDTAHFNATAAEANFIVQGYGTTRQLLVNEIAPYDGTLIVPSDANKLLEVRAMGPWSIDFT